MDSPNLATDEFSHPRLSTAIADEFDLLLNDEALTVLALNDMCAQLGLGKFFYLPEPDTLALNPSPDGSVSVHRHLKSVVPRLLYTQYVWNSQDQATYREGDEIKRWHFVQSKSCSSDDPCNADILYAPNDPILSDRNS